MMMYQQYIQEWKKYTAKYGDKVCFLMLVGKFYELYDILDKETQEGQTNVKQAVEVMGIQLPIKKGDGPNGEDCYAAGFPDYVLQKYVTMLTKEDWTVVVTQQKKNSSGKVTGRPVERIFSPGTHIESAGMDTPYLAGLWMEETSQAPPSFSAVCMDLTTGNLFSFEGQTSGSKESWTSDELVNFFQIYKPKELVLFWRGDAFSMPSEPYLRMRFELPNGLVHRQVADSETQNTFENRFIRGETLKRFFSEHGLLSIREYLQIAEHQKTERCLVNILLFAEDHFPAAVKNLSTHTVWTPRDTLYLGNHSLVQLNYITHNNQESVYNLFQKTITTIGRRALKTRLLQPSSNVRQIERKLKELDYCIETPPPTLKAVETQLRLMFDISRLHRKIMTYTCEALDIIALDQSYSAISQLFPKIGSTGSPFSFDPWIAEFDEMRKDFHKIFDVNKAARLANQEEDVSFFRDEVAPECHEVELALKTLLEQAKQSVAAMIEWAGLPPEAITLEVRGGESATFQANIKKACAGPLATRMKSTGNPMNIQIHVRNTVKSYIEYPELQKIATQYESQRWKLQQAIVKELPGLCLDCMNHCEAIWEVLEDWVGRVDSNYALAKVCKERGYTRPHLVEPKGFSGFQAEGLRHPLLESLQSRVEYVKHNVSLGFTPQEDKGWLLYGMNASGKSSLMKAMGIAVLLAQCGCYVPATKFSLYPFKSLLTRILNHDNLWAGLSSFAVEMSELRDIFSRAESHSLVLGDELCSGTESVSATSLVAAGIQYLNKKGTRFVFATHLHGLESLEKFEGVGVWHLKCHYDEQLDRLVYDRTLHPGSGETKYGIEVAKAMHIPPEIIDAAFSYRRKLEGETTVQEATQSNWNRNIVLHRCERCGSKLKSSLEVHHIKQRKEADAQGFFQDGTHQNDLKNLIVLCHSCHDAHHRGEFEIGPLQMTDKGETRSFPSSPESSPPKPTNEIMPLIIRYLREYPNMSNKMIASLIQTKEGITTTPHKIAAIRKTTANQD